MPETVTARREQQVIPTYIPKEPNAIAYHVPHKVECLTTRFPVLWASQFICDDDLIHQCIQAKDIYLPLLSLRASICDNPNVHAAFSYSLQHICYSEIQMNIWLVISVYLQAPFLQLLRVDPLIF